MGRCQNIDVRCVLLERVPCLESARWRRARGTSDDGFSRVGAHGSAPQADAYACLQHLQIGIASRGGVEFLAEGPLDQEQAVDVLWMTAALGCDGDSVALTGATEPTLEDLVDGVLPHTPPLRLHHPIFAVESGAKFLEVFERAAQGKLEKFVLVVEGSIPDESLAGDGVWAGFGQDASGQPIPTCQWIDRLTRRATAVVAMGTCSAYGGIHALPGNPTGCTGLQEYLGESYRSAAGLPIVNVPGCPTLPNNQTEVLAYLLRMVAGKAPPIPLDEQGRPQWLFAQTVHESCSRGGHYEQASFIRAHGEPQCLVKLGCWGPVVQCNVGARGWQGGVGGCANVGGGCIGCTMPGFAERFMPFMDEPPGAVLSTGAVKNYGTMVRALRRFTIASMNSLPEGRRRLPLVDQRKGESDDGES